MVLLPPPLRCFPFLPPLLQGAVLLAAAPAFADGAVGASKELASADGGMRTFGTQPQRQVRELPANWCAGQGGCDPFGQVPHVLRPGPPLPEPPPAKVPPVPLTMTLGMDLPLSSTQPGGSGALGQGSPPVSPTLQAGLRYVPAENWFAAINFYRYLLGDRQQPWNPDFTYSFGYDDWRPGTYSLVYGNYTGNRLAPSSPVSRFEQGQWSLSYKFKPEGALKRWLAVDETHEIDCSINGNLTPRYTDFNTQALRSYKTSAALGCRYRLPNHFYFNLTAFKYLRPDQQQPWDPDFAYGFGMVDWRNGGLNLQYNNYSGNRFPWRQAAPGQGGFRNGSVTISWSSAW